MKRLLERTNMKPLTWIALAVVPLFFASAAFAGAERCKDVGIIVDNQSDTHIKVVDIKYYDSTKSGDKWRNENAVKAKVALEGRSVDYVRNLEEVLNDPNMKVKVEYKKDTGRGWGKGIWSNSSETKTCTKGQSYTVVVN
jgi:hypothetical protein